MNGLDEFTLNQIGFGRGCLKHYDDRPTVYEKDESFLRRIYIKMLRGHYSYMVEFEDGLTMGYDRSYLR